MKKRYLCPVCEHELTGKSYCPECRRIRREPLIYEGGALPNESSIEDYAVIQAKDSSSANGSYKKSPEKKSEMEYADTCGSGHTHTYGIPNRDPHKQRKTAGGGLRAVSILLFIAAVVFVIILCIKPIKEAAVKVWEDAGISELFGEKDNVDEQPASWESEDFGEISEEKVLAEGVPCNGYNHYDMDGREYLERLQDYCERVWPEEILTVREGESSNWFSNGFTYYEIITSLYLEKTGAWIDVSCDTVTGEVMRMSAYAEDEDTAKKLVLVMACALQPDEDRSVIWTEVEDMFSRTEEDYFFEDWRMSEFYLSDDGSHYFMSLDCLEIYDKY